MPLSPAELEELKALNAELGPPASASPSGKTVSVGFRPGPLSPKEQEELKALNAELGPPPPAAGASASPQTAYDYGGTGLTADAVLPPPEPPKAEYDALPNWVRMPEFRHFSSLLGTAGVLGSNRAETKKILKAQFGLESQDDGGYTIFTSKEDGQKYRWSPGADWGDVVRGVGGAAVGLAGTAALASAPVALLAATGLGPTIAAAVPAGAAAVLSAVSPYLAAAGAAGAGALTQEIVEKVAGGDFNTWQIPLAMVIGPMVHGASKGLRTFGHTVLGTKPPLPPAGSAVAGSAAAAATPEMESAALNTAAARQEDTAARAAQQQLVDRIEQGKAAAAAQATAAARQQETAAAAAAAQKQTAATAAEAAAQIPPLPPSAVPGIAQRGENALRDAATTLDPSFANKKVLDRFKAVIKNYEKKGDAAYDALKAEIPDHTPFVPDEVISELTKKAKGLGGIEHLGPDLRKIYDDLVPQVGKASTEYPTWGRADRAMKRMGAITRQQEGPFRNPDVDGAYISHLSGKLKNDVITNAERIAGKGKELDAAKALVAKRYSYQERAAEVLGPQVEGKLSGDALLKLSPAVKTLAEGNYTALDKLASALPKSIRSDTVMSTIAAEFGDRTSGLPVDLGRFAPWWERVNNNHQSLAVLVKHTSPEARSGLGGLYKVGQDMAVAVAEEKAEKSAWDTLLKEAQKKAQTARVEAKYAVGQLEKASKAVQSAVGEEAKLATRAEARAASQKVREASAAVTSATQAETKVGRQARAVEVEKARAIREIRIAKKLSGGSWFAQLTPPVLARVLKSDVVKKISSTLGFKRAMDAFKVPASERTRWLESAFAAAAAGTPLRTGLKGDK